MGLTLLHETRRLPQQELETLSQVPVVEQIQGESQKKQELSEFEFHPRETAPRPPNRPPRCRRRFPRCLPHSQVDKALPGSRGTRIVIHVVVLGDSVPLKKFVAVCLNEVLVARQNAFGQRLDGGQFQRLFEGALEVTVAVTFELCGVQFPVTNTAANDTSFLVGEAETLGKKR